MLFFQPNRSDTSSKFGIFKMSIMDPPPVIRMVYALAARKSPVCVVRQPSRKANEEKANGYTSCDIRLPPRRDSIRREQNLTELFKLSQKCLSLKKTMSKADAKSKCPCATSSSPLEIVGNHPVRQWVRQFNIIPTKCRQVRMKRCWTWSRKSPDSIVHFELAALL